MFFKALSKKTDQELMQLLQHGNSDAITMLYQRYSYKVVRYFYRMLGRDKAKAQDFLQDLFMKLIEKPEYFDTNRKFSTWLYSVAHNMCKNEYRKQALRNAVNIVDVDQQLFENLTQKTLEQKEFENAVATTLEQMDENDKNLFTLRHELEMSVEEIAEILDCPAGTVKSRLFYLKKKLADQLQVYHPINQ